MMMRKMREIGEDNYYSTDFVNLLRYLSYCSNRTDLIFQIKVLYYIYIYKLRIRDYHMKLDPN